MRSIATETGVNASLVIHYFGTKERLFREVVDLPFDPDLLIASIIEGPIDEGRALRASSWRS